MRSRYCEKQTGRDSVLSAGAHERQSWRHWLGFGLGPKGASQHGSRNDEQSIEAKAAGLQEAEGTPGKAAASPFADLKDRQGIAPTD